MHLLDTFYDEAEKTKSLTSNENDADYLLSKIASFLLWPLVMGKFFL